MTYRITGLDPARFAPLFGLDEAVLAAHGAARVRVEAPNSAPCRLSLDDAPVGASMLLLSHEHQPATTPYRQQGPIFVREGETEAATYDDTVPPAMARRVLSIRAFDAQGMMVDADVVDGAEAEAVIRRLLARPDTDYLHAHYARRGCFAATIRRA